MKLQDVCVGGGGGNGCSESGQSVGFMGTKTASRAWVQTQPGQRPAVAFVQDHCALLDQRSHKNEI